MFGPFLISQILSRGILLYLFNGIKIKVCVCFFFCLVSQRSRISVDVPPTGFANLRVINAGVCKINAFGIGLNTEVPLMQV